MADIYKGRRRTIIIASIIVAVLIIMPGPWFAHVMIIRGELSRLEDKLHGARSSAEEQRAMSAILRFVSSKDMLIGSVYGFERVDTGAGVRDIDALPEGVKVRICILYRLHRAPVAYMECYTVSHVLVDRKNAFILLNR
jgi:hypothetical protein